MGWKYVMFEYQGRMVPVIFPDILVHDSMAMGVRAAVIDAARKARLPWKAPKPVSAGIIEGLDVDFATGRSETLDLVSHEDDKRIINGYPYQHGVGYEREN